MKKVLLLISIVFIVFSFAVFKDINQSISENSKIEKDESIKITELTNFFFDDDGKQFDVNSLFAANKKIYFHFWATWCPPCKDEMPKILSFFKNSSDLLIIVAVSDTPEKVRSYLKTLEIPKNVLSVHADSDAIERSLAVYKLPETLIFSPEKSLLGRLSGAQTWSE